MVEELWDAYGQVTRYSYATPSHMTMITDPLGYNTTHRYDTVYRLIQEVNNKGEATNYAYGEDGNGKSLRDPEPLYAVRKRARPSEADNKPRRRSARVRL